MTRTGRGLLIAALVTIAVTLMAIGWFVASMSGSDPRCVRDRTRENSRVRTDRAWQEHEIPGTGKYLKVHYLEQIQAGPYCTRGIPAQVEWEYQGVIRLRPEDAAALRESRDWTSGAPTVDPLLTEWAPASASWLDAGLTRDHPEDRLSGLYLDPEAGLLYFTGQNLDRPEPAKS